MKKRGMMYKVLCIVLLGVMSLTLALPSVALAADHADVTITAQPSFIAITGTDTWTINGLTGTGRIAPDTIYYSNPLGDTTAPTSTVVDGECEFTVTNASSTVPLDLTVNIAHFTGGDAMQNSNSDGSNGANAYGAFVYYSGMTFANKVVAKSTGSSAMTTDWSGATLKWGIQLETQSGAWASGSAQTSTATITATEHT
jgi:hypothetical protein